MGVREKFCYNEEEVEMDFNIEVRESGLIFWMGWYLNGIFLKEKMEVEGLENYRRNFFLFLYGREVLG